MKKRMFGKPGFRMLDQRVSLSYNDCWLVDGLKVLPLLFFIQTTLWITKRTSARYPAMICSFSGLLFYLFLSGADVATQRAFLTTSLMFAAFILGRNVFTIRNTALVFAALLITNPHYLVQPGFQLSFAAIFGLLWFLPTRNMKNFHCQ